MTEATKNGAAIAGRRLPYGALLWLLAALLIFAVGQRTVTLHDQEKFIGDFAFAVEQVEGERRLILNLTAGSFVYGVTPEVILPVPTGRFSRGDPSAPQVAQALFDALDSLSEITIAAQTITVAYQGNMEAEQARSRLRRPVNNAVANDRGTITAQVSAAAENTIVFSTSDERFRYAQYQPALVESIEEYDSRAAAEAGSDLARFIVSESRPVESLRLEPTRLVVGYAEGAALEPLARNLREILNDFHPRASLAPSLWLLTAAPEIIPPLLAIAVEPLETGIPLILFTLLMVAVEAGIFFVIPHKGKNNLLIHLVHIAAVFLLFWSILGHEPLWDAILHAIFPTSAQLVHPQGTVIDFAAQHLELVLTSSIYIISGGLFLGVMVTRENFREFLPLVNNVVNSGQTVPTLAIVAIMAPIIGLGFMPAVVALIAYGLLPVVRNTIAGIESVSVSIVDSARGMGMTSQQILLRTELPIASRIIMAGIRTSMVINIGTATLGAFVGSGGLGIPIASGLSMTVDAFILLGAIPAALLAILTDYVLGRLEVVLTPRGLLIET